MEEELKFWKKQIKDKGWGPVNIQRAELIRKKNLSENEKIDLDILQKIARKRAIELRNAIVINFNEEK